eukprot:scaffold824_cov175-Alexandrium_tamarense.AAC.13
MGQERSHLLPFIHHSKSSKTPTIMCSLEYQPTQSQEQHQTYNLHYPTSVKQMNASPSSVENFLHEQEGSSTDAGSLKTLSSVDLGVFRIDTQEDVGDEDNDVDTLPSTNKKDQNCDEKDGDINLIHDNHCHDNLPLYKATTTIDYAEATIVAPVDLSEGSLLRVDIGRHRILVAEVPTGGMHLNWYGQSTTPSIPSSSEKSRCSYTTICIVSLYTSAFVLTSLLIYHLLRALYCYIAYDNNGIVLRKPGEAQEMNGVEEHDIIPVDIATCKYEVDTKFTISAVVIVLMVWSYISFLICRSRSALRDQHYIHGSAVTDCAVSCCCNCCTLAQITRESAYDHDAGTEENKKAHLQVV